MGRFFSVAGGLTLMASLASCTGAHSQAVPYSVLTASPTISAGVTSPLTTSQASPTPLESPSPQASLAATGCATSQLLITVGGGDGGAAGSRITSVNFLNRSKMTCVLTGFPGVSFVNGANHQQVGRPAERTGSAARVVLKPQSRAHALLRIVSYQLFEPMMCQPKATKGFLIYPPNQRTAVFVSAPGLACASTKPQAGQLNVQSVQEGSPDD